jgi:hypothetical protein
MVSKGFDIFNPGYGRGTVVREGEGRGREPHKARKMELNHRFYYFFLIFGGWTGHLDKWVEGLDGLPVCIRTGCLASQARSGAFLQASEVETHRILVSLFVLLQPRLSIPVGDCASERLMLPSA